jgi:hypothetical protein
VGDAVRILDQESLTWVSVEDQLPDESLRVLVHCPDFPEPVQFGWYDGVYWFSDDEDFGEGEVSAWANVPEGPKR